MLDVFNSLCEWLETNCEMELLSLAEIHQHLQEIGNGEEVYSRKHLKRKLVDRYGEHIVFAEMCERFNVVCFRDMCSFIINEKWYNDRKESVVDDNERIVIMAAKLIASQIRQIESNTATYPVMNKHAGYSQYVPSLLKTFMKILVASKLKQRTCIQEGKTALALM